MITVTQPNGDEPVSYCTPELIFNRFWGFLVHYAIKFTGDQKEAEDIVSAVFVKMLNSKITFPTPTDAKAYLSASVRNGCYDFLDAVKKKNLHHTAFSYLASHPEDDETLALHRAIISDLHLKKVMDELSEKDRLFLTYCLDDSLSMKEVARLTNHTIKGAYTKKSNLLKQLRNVLMKYKF